LESTRTCGDEFKNDLLYTILLKQQRKPPVSDFEPGHIETTKIKLLKAGSIDRLVDHLACAPIFRDEKFLSIFLSTYRTFILPYQVLDMLFLRYNHLDREKLQKSYESRKLPDNVAIKESILLAVMEWLARHPEDWNQIKNKRCRVLIKKTKEFCKANRPHAAELETAVKTMLQVAKEIRKKGKIDELQPYEMELSGFPSDDLDRTSINGKSAELFLNRLSVTEIVRSLSAVDKRLFCAVQPWQCLGSVWSRRGQGAEIATVKATVRQFNSVVYLVVSTVLSPCLNLPQRTKMLENWIQIGAECLRLRNYNALRAVASGLQSHAVHRLKKTWAAVDRGILSTFQQVQSVSKETNYGNESIPYLGHFLTDLMMIDAAYSDKIEGGRLINFEKRRKEHELLKTIAKLQDSCRDAENFKNLEITPIFKTWISFVQPLSEQQSLELSLMIEPDAIVELEPLSSRLAGSPMEHSFSTLLQDSEKIESTGSSIDSSIQSESDEAHSQGGRHSRHVSSEALSSETPQPLATSNSKSFSEEFGQSLMVRISVEDAACSAGINYRTIRIYERDRVSNLIVTTLDKFNLSTTNIEKWKLLQRTDDGKELSFPSNSAIFHCVSGYTGIIMLIVKRKSSKELETEDLNKQQRRKRLLPQDNLAVTSKLM